ncbi:MAG: glycosyltransferase, partial [Coriobacteriales bacterium]|nr:glycosyltransferase [Coriobacteriales bacterium]
QNEIFSVYARLDFDGVIVHDPQPLPLVRYYRKRQPWIWRCHIDLSTPYPPLWDLLEKYILRYDAMVVSSDEFRQRDFGVPQVVFTPAIDPLSLKNSDMDEATALMHLKDLGVPVDRPYILQVSRFDKWKDMAGVVRCYRQIREECGCRLVLTGGRAADDPEGAEQYALAEEEAGELLKSRDVILLTDASNAQVNALQRTAAVITQKSLREGFGLTVTEGMWKGRPVVGTCVGGIPLQIDDGENGLLVDPGDDDGFIKAVLRILKDPDFADELGRNAREKVRENFLITKLLDSYLELLNRSV